MNKTREILSKYVSKNARILGFMCFFCYFRPFHIPSSIYTNHFFLKFYLKIEFKYIHNK
jgi:hypothetical protein